jgi:hypothetical protein
MKSRWKRAGIGLLVVLAAAQAYRPPRNSPEEPSGKRISGVLPMPPEVETILRTSCYDCHSNSTRYPWYAEIQPVGWLLWNHISDGKRGLNFDEYAGYRPFRQLRKLQQIREEVEEKGMPLPSYLIIHTDAKLTPVQQDLLTRWASAGEDSLRARYPADSLQRPQSRPAPASVR